jgi:NADP-dependent 3-hydroxy acid dehydrogenase YdfG
MRNKFGHSPKTLQEQTMADKPLALVTGASSGIGKDLTIKLAKAGYEVMAAARREDRLSQLAEEHEGIIPAPLDLTRHDELEVFCQRIMDLNRPLDILVNNAGYSVRGMVDEVPWMRPGACTRSTSSRPAA